MRNGGADALPLSVLRGWVTFSQSHARGQFFVYAFHAHLFRVRTFLGGGPPVATPERMNHPSWGLPNIPADEATMCYESTVRMESVPYPRDALPSSYASFSACDGPDVDPEIGNGSESTVLSHVLRLSGIGSLSLPASY